MRLRLKDLNKISGDVIDTKGVMREVVGFKKYWFFKKLLFGVALRKAMTIIKIGRDTDISKLTLSDDCEIKPPKSMNNITFVAAMELQSTIGNSVNDSDISDLMSSVISIACYSENIEKHYDSESEKFKEFKERILNLPMDHMIGLYNHIIEETKKTQAEWKRRFASVEVNNADLKQAGIDSMQQFSVINTIKSICADFNYTEKEAWQTSYALSQTSSYSKATYDFIHENLRILKEHKMKAQRRAKHS